MVTRDAHEARWQRWEQSTPPARLTELGKRLVVRDLAARGAQLEVKALKEDGRTPIALAAKEGARPFASAVVSRAQGLLRYCE